ncbi:MAG: JAB domain-containing protein [Firmicutes bacterium]|nr:JAB domain-containing protein [Bacillota bacterium]
MIRDIPTSERPRERVLKFGVESLSNSELLSIVLRCGTREKSVKDLSLEIISMVGDISNFKDLTLNKLLSIKGIGYVKAIELISVVELSKRIYASNDKKLIKINSSKDVFCFYKDLFLDKKQELFYCLYLNNKNYVIERKLLFMGTINKSVVHPREVFKNAYLSSASGIICIHNHPSGDVNPSIEDKRFTKALVDIGNVQNIPILDHIIIGEDNYFSFMENNLI